MTTGFHVNSHFHFTDLLSTADLYIMIFLRSRQVCETIEVKIFVCFSALQGQLEESYHRWYASHPVLLPAN